MCNWISPTQILTEIDQMGRGGFYDERGGGVFFIHLELEIASA